MFQENVMDRNTRGWSQFWVQLLAVLVMGWNCLAADAPAKGEASKTVGTEYLSVGDKIRVSYSDIPTAVPPTEQQIPESKKIRLHLNLEVDFVGKTKSQLESEIRDLYISKGFYKNIKIDIDVPLRTFYVGGEVRAPSVYPHQANLTLTKALDMAGGFTDFAKKRTINITRADGTRVKVSWFKATKDTKHDPLIHPGDRIQVDKTAFF